MTDEPKPQKPGPFDPTNDPAYRGIDVDNPVKWRDPTNRKRQGWPNNEKAYLDPDAPFGCA